MSWLLLLSDWSVGQHCVAIGRHKSGTDDTTHTVQTGGGRCATLSHTSECWEILLPKKFKEICLTTDNKSFRRNLSFANPPRSKSKPLNDSKVKSDQNLHCCDDYQIQNCSEYLISEGKVWIMYLNNCKKVSSSVCVVWGPHVLYGVALHTPGLKLLH